MAQYGLKRNGLGPTRQDLLQSQKLEQPVEYGDEDLRLSHHGTTHWRGVGTVARFTKRTTRVSCAPMHMRSPGMLQFAFPHQLPGDRKQLRMGIAYDSSDLARNEVLIGVLSKFSPTDIIQSTELKTSFRDFFGRGTVEDCVQLVQWVSKAVLSDTHRHNTISSKPSLTLLDGVPSSNDTSSCNALGDTLTSTAVLSAVSANTIISKPITSLPTADPQACIRQPSPTADAPLSIRKNFEAKGFLSDRVNRLTRYVLSFVNAEVLRPEAYDNLWSDKGKIFTGSEKGIRRICRLQRGRRQIEERMSQYGTAARLCLMFAVADVDHYALTATSTELGLRPHRKRKTAALEKISEVNNISIDDLHQDKRKSRNYFELLFGLGPGSLLLIGPLTGPDAASWEVNTNKEDVGLVLEYIRIHLPRLYDTLIELNGVGARTMVKGLLAYGWTVEEVKSSPVPFMKAVRKHLDENLMIPMTEGVVPATQHPYTTNLSSKRKADKDHAHKFYTSNQSSSAFDDYTAETSPPDEDSIESWLLANSLQKSNSSGSSQRQLVSMDPHMTSSLYAVDCLPSSLEQDPSRERVLTIDPNMMSTLGAVGGLPSSPEPSSSRERVLTINPNLLTIDPSMTSSLGAGDCLHLWSEIQVGRGCSQCTQT